MAIIQSKQAAARVPAVSLLNAVEGAALVFEFAFSTLAQVPINTIIEMGALPAGAVLAAPPVLSCEDVDTGTTLTLDVGLMTGQYLAALDDAGAARTCGAEFLSASNVGQAGGLVTSAVAAGMRLSPATYDRSFGVKIAAAPTGVNAAAKLRLHVLVAPAPYGI